MARNKNKTLIKTSMTLRTKPMLSLEKFDVGIDVSFQTLNRNYFTFV